MPALMTLRLLAPARPPSPPALLGAACRLFETAGSDHTAAVKPFAVGPWTQPPAGPYPHPSGQQANADDVAGEREWRLGWLLDSPPPGWPPATVTFGERVCPVLGETRQSYPFPVLAATPPVRRVTIRVLTPLFFSRNGRDLPLPDPVLLLRSALMRWNALAPAPLHLDEQQLRAVTDAVYLASLAEGRTTQRSLGPGLRQTGFVGTIELALRRATPEPTAALFAALIRFAAIAGAGALTTHGFGALDVLCSPSRPTPTTSRRWNSP